MAKFLNIPKPKLKTPPPLPANADFLLLQKAIPLTVGWLVFLVSISFFTGTYDSAFVKLTLFQTGAVMLAAWWGAKLLIARRNPFTRERMIFFLPLLAYMAWQTFSFLCFPYKTATTEEFTRQILYTLVTLVIACEFTQDNVKTLSKFIVAAAWVSFLYGALQIAAIWFPTLDLVDWRGFFGHRIFSTHTNPNFFGAFIVFSSCIIGAQYLITRSKKLLALLALGLVCLVFTESKGAWLAYAASAVVFGFGFLHISAAKVAKKRITAAAIILMLCALIGAGFYASKRFQSVSFRTYTWLSAFEMVQDSPVKGTGIGSFKVVYPAYRRPQIFYLENAHNNETQHAENEYLEQWAVGGTVGLALFLWVIVFLGVLTCKNLTAPLPEKPQRADKECKFLWLGYGTALAGLLVHAFVDISVHFASSGLLLAVFMGVLLALGINHPEEATCPEGPEPKHPMVLRVAKIIGYLCSAFTVAYIFLPFMDIMLTLARRRFGDWIVGAVTFLTMMACLSAANYVYMRTIMLTKKLRVIVILVLSFPFILFAYNVFQANHYYSVGVALINRHDTESALEFFTKAIKLNPFQLEYRQYRGAVLATALDLNTRFLPSHGDKKAPSNDYERALKDFTHVLARHPNHALLHQSIAQTYYTAGVKYAQAAYRATAAEKELYNRLTYENFENAKRALKMALDLDPVNPDTYEMLASIALMEYKVDEAQAWLDRYRNDPAEVADETLLATHQNNARIERMQGQVDFLRGQMQAYRQNSAQM